MKELIPKNPNLIKPPRIKKIRDAQSIRSVSTQSNSKPQGYAYTQDVDPLKDAGHLVKYYRAFLSHQAGGVRIKFDGYGSDATQATQILDLMIENNKNDKIFLISWLKYFYDNKLKGLKALKIKYTSMKVFKETFDEFNVTYFVPQTPQ